MDNQHLFSQIPGPEIQRSSFDRSSTVKLTLDAGWLIPIFVDEVLPGDTFNLKFTGFGRLATPLFPLMDNMYLDDFWFFVSYRLLWDNWERFNGAQTNPGDSTDFLTPVVYLASHGTSVAEGGIFDYMGIPPGVAGLEFSALPFRAYNRIYNEWFRDENLQDSLDETTGDGPDGVTIAYALQRRGKRHDYFTSCLPFPQKGDPVSLPIGTSAPVVPAGSGSPTFDLPGRANTAIGGVNASNQALWTAGTTTGGNAVWNTTALAADLTSATAATINQIRQAFQIQRLLERDARGGTRYTEIIRSHFGVVSPDARLQRPEYLGGGSTPVIVSQVPQTSAQVAGSTPQGNLAAYGTVTTRDHGFTQSFTEHGVVIGLVSVRADLTYQQGLERMWTRRTRYDFYWPALSHLGEQAVLNKEIYAQGTAGGSADNQVFGYQERYAEYRYKPSRLAALMRSSATGSLDAWNLSQNFTALPVLGPGFIVEDPPVDRVIAVPSEPHFLLDCDIRLRCARPMPVYSVPGLVDHF